MITRRDFNLLTALALQTALEQKAFGLTGTTLAEAAGPRRVGAYRPNSRYLNNGFESIDLLSGNLNVTMNLLQVVSRSLRCQFFLSYNSQIWENTPKGVQEVGGDVGFGFGWSVHLGSIVPTAPVTVPVVGVGVPIGYTWIDFTGAEFPMQFNAGVWETRQGLHVTFEPALAQVHFNTGTWWKMGCVSAAGEPDAGAMYPTVMQDANGNQILLRYLPGAGSNAPDSSARVSEIEDARATATAAGRASYRFTYSSGAGPHLTSITSLCGTSENYIFKYAPLSVKSPFGGNTASVQSLVGFGQLNAPSWSFQYDASSTGEITAVTGPTGGKVGWAYGNSTPSGGVTVRMVTDRFVTVTTPKGFSAVTQYTFQRSPGQAAGKPASVVAMAAAGVGTLQTYAFDATPNSWSAGLLLSIVNSDPDGTTLQHQEFEWTQTDNGNVYRSAMNTTLSPASKGEALSRVETVLDSYGNTQVLRTFDFNALSTPSTVTTNTFVTDSRYTSRYLRHLLSTTIVTAKGASTQTKSFVYDSTPLVALPSLFEHDEAVGLSSSFRGNPTEVVIGGKHTRRTYDTTGTLVKVETLAGPSVDITPLQDSNNAAIGQVRVGGDAALGISFGYDSALRPVSLQNAAGATTSRTYDALGRIASITKPGRDPVLYSWDSTGTVVTVQKGQSWTRRSYDTAGRIVTADRGLAGSDVPTHTADFEYDQIHTTKVSRATGWYAVGTTPDWKTHSYDGLGRPTKITPKGGSGAKSFRYEGNTRIITDAAGRVKGLRYGSTGLLQEVIQPGIQPGSSAVHTLYDYDAPGHLTAVTMPRDAAVQRRQFQYDAQGRVVEKRLVESGATSYAYDSGGRIASRIDALGTRTTYAYDQLGRMVLKSYFNASGQEDAAQRVTFHYDEQSFEPGYSENALGRLAAVQWGDAATLPGQFTESYKYDSAGNITGRRLTVQRGAAKNSLDTGYTYNAQGTLQSLTYPGKLGTFEYTYDGLGNPTGMAQATESGRSQIVKGGTYTPHGDLTSIKVLVPGTDSYYAENRTYNARNQLTAIQAQPEQAGAETNWMPTVDLRYSYDPKRNDGKIRAITDAVAGETILYSYDVRGRLAAAETSRRGDGLRFGYDDFNNLITQQSTTVGAGSFNAPVNPATNRVAHPSVVYDANGNIIQSAGMTLSYDGENRVTSVSSTRGPEQYAYHPLTGDRIWTKNASGEELSVYSAKGRKIASFGLEFAADTVTTTSASTNVYFRGRMIYSNGAAVVTDPVRSVRARISAAGVQEAGVFSYYPFGQDRTAGSSGSDATSTAQKNALSRRVAGFGSAETDASGFIAYARNRNYDTVLSKLLSPSTSRPKLDNPDSWNAYALANNDPVNDSGPIDLQPDNTTYGNSTGGGGGGSWWSTITVSTSYQWSTRYSDTTTSVTSVSYSTTYSNDVNGGLVPENTTTIALSITGVIPSVQEVAASLVLVSIVSYLTKQLVSVVTEYGKEWAKEKGKRDAKKWLDEKEDKKKDRIIHR